MVNGISNRSIFTVLTQSHAKTTSRFEYKNKYGLQDNLLRMIAEKDPDKADAFKQKLEEWNRTADMLKTAKKDFSEQRKAAAREKIEQIKKELQMLQMLAVTNPKAAARRLAQLSRELSAAVKSYAAASAGSGVDISSTPSLTDATATTTTSGGGSAATVSELEQGGDQVTTSPPQQTEAEAAVATDDAAQENLSDEPTEDLGEGAPNVKEAVMATFNEMEKKSSERREDAKFAADVREIKNMIKGILATIKRAMEDGKEKDDLIGQVEDDLANIDSSLSELTSSVQVDAGVVVPSLNISI